MQARCQNERNDDDKFAAPANHMGSLRAPSVEGKNNKRSLRNDRSYCGLCRLWHALQLTAALKSATADGSPFNLFAAS